MYTNPIVYQACIANISLSSSIYICNMKLHHRDNSSQRNQILRSDFVHKIMLHVVIHVIVIYDKLLKPLSDSTILL